MNKILMIILLFAGCFDKPQEIERLPNSVSPSFQNIIGEWKIESMVSNSKWQKYEDFVVYQFVQDSSGAKYIKVSGLQKKTKEFRFALHSDSLTMMIYNRTNSDFSEILKYRCHLSQDENTLELISNDWGIRLSFLEHEYFQRTFDAYN